ncbi:MAG: P1 family peptidase [Acidobacteria bacterium]|nr:P1 family peptidase [Acidobacteriota bacterium]
MPSAAILIAIACLAQEPRPRARELGIAPGVYPPGPLNAITDVAGVLVGHTTLIEGDRIRTGVTAILPHGGNLFQDKVAGAVFVGNAFGKLAGALQVNELGQIETPIILTNTLAVGTAVEAVVAHTLAQAGNERVVSVNAVAGETNDSRLNDIRALPVRREHVTGAIRAARPGPVEEGSVGAGTGTVAFGWKGGIGTASRRLAEGYTLGVLVQTNYGGELTIGGVKAGRAALGTADGSCMIVVATDAPADARDLGRLAARAVFAMGRTGGSYSNGSGDFAIAFSTSAEMRTRAGERGVVTRRTLTPEGMSPLFQAVLEATEEAIYNSMLRARSVGGGVEPLPIGRLRAILGPKRP